jgi:gluconolactonase
MSFFAPPRRVESTVFTRLPDRFRRLRRSAWADANRDTLEIDSFLEGPSFDREGRLYVTDIPFGRVFRIDPAGEWEQIAEYDGWPNGLKIHRDGRIFMTDYKRGLMLLDPASGRVSPYFETVGSESFKGVNDLVFGRSGTIYFTDQGQTGMHDSTGRVYRLTPDGRLTCLIDTIPSPNGIVVDPEETALLVAVTRANQIWRVPLHKSGLVTKVGIFAHLHGGLGGPDGLALDTEGCLLIAHEGFGSIWRLSPHAEPLDRIVTCTARATMNLAFGGPNNARLYIVESETGSILQADLSTPGLPMFSHL